MAFDDNGGGGTNSRIPAGSGMFTLPATGIYYIWVESIATNATGTYTLALDGTASGYARTYVQKAYVSYYGRPADPAGLAYWAARMDAEGGSLNVDHRSVRLLRRVQSALRRARSPPRS